MKLKMIKSIKLTRTMATLGVAHFPKNRPPG